jgi:hypothetical protein
MPRRRDHVHVHDLQRQAGRARGRSEQRGPGGSQLRIAAFVSIDDDRWSEGDAHLIGAGRNVEQHQ